MKWDIAVAGDQSEYYSFLLRLWVVGKKKRRAWRVTLENPQTQEVLGFKTLRSSFEYLEALISQTEKEE